MRRFAPHPVPTLLVAILLPLFVWLGVWQWQRAEEKDVLLARHQQQQSLPPVTLEALLQAPDSEGRHVQLYGRFDAGHSLLLDNRSRDGRAGVELLQPFQDQASGVWLLLNRGWLPWPDRRALPAYRTPDTLQAVQAWVYVPPGPAFRLQADPDTEGWPRLVTTLDLPLFWAGLQREGYAHELRLEPGPLAYRTDWPVVNMQPAKHRAYAVQWFTFAALLPGLYAYLGLKPAGEQA